MVLLKLGDTAAGLADFAARRAAVKERRIYDTVGLAAFLKAAGSMLGYRKRRHAPIQTDPVRFTNAMTAIAVPLRLARDAGVLADPWMLAGLKRREVANAGVLAGLWSPTLGGKIAIDFLSAFFERLRPRAGGAALPDGVVLSTGYLVRTEDRPMGNEADRIDITIEGKNFLVGIEVKIDAGLQPDQLARYQTAICARASGQGKQATVVFLSRRQTSHAGVINARWDDVAVTGRAVASQRSAARDINHHLIERFAAHVARF